MCECVWGCIYVIIPVCGLNSSTKLIKANKSSHDAMCQTHVAFIVHFPLRAFVSDVYNCILLLVIWCKQCFLFVASQQSITIDVDVA